MARKQNVFVYKQDSNAVRSRMKMNQKSFSSRLSRNIQHFGFGLCETRIRMFEQTLQIFEVNDNVLNDG